MNARRLGGLTLSVALLSGGGLAAQTVGLGVQGVFGDYREQTGSLHYTGSGGALTAWAAKGKFGAEVVVTGITYKPADDGTAVDEFKATQIDARLRYYIAGAVSVEAGFTNRTVDKEFAAQEVGAIRFGARGHYVLGPGADIVFRANYLGGAKFSGGGKASLGVEFGLGLSVGKSNGRYRVIGDYEFQRFNRTTDNGSGTIKVPLQQAVARIGVAVGF